MTFIYFLAIATFLFLCFLLTVIVLMQESKSTGFGASFGGEASDSLFGVSTPKVLKVVTGWLACAFMMTCLFLSAWTSVRGRWHEQPSIEKAFDQEYTQEQ